MTRCAVSDLEVHSLGLKCTAWGTQQKSCHAHKQARRVLTTLVMLRAISFSAQEKEWMT